MTDTFSDQQLAGDLQGMLSQLKVFLDKLQEVFGTIDVEFNRLPDLVPLFSLLASTDWHSADSVHKGLSALVDMLDILFLDNDQVAEFKRFLAPNGPVDLAVYFFNLISNFRPTGSAG